MEPQHTRRLTRGLNISAFAQVVAQLACVAAVTQVAAIFTAPTQAQCVSWAQVSSTGPAARSSYAIAYDAARQRTIIFGGYSNADPRKEFLADTWEWDGSRWTQVATTGPGARANAAMVYDSARQRTVLFGGFAVVNGVRVLQDDTWEWDGQRWTRTLIGTVPPRFSHAMAYDSVRQQVVMFGGYGLAGAFLADTWTYANGAWTQVNTTGPTERYGHAMAFDAQRGRAVMFGGYGNPAGRRRYLGDVWEWTGTAWQERPAAGNTPSPRFFHAMTYDASRQAVVLVGGRAGASTHSDTWEWNGVSWRKTAGDDPGRRESFGLVYDAARSKLTLFGGFGDRGRFADTWMRNTSAIAPQISTQPAPVFARANSAVQFNVATSSVGTFSYQWLKDGTPVSSNTRFTGATSATLRINPVLVADAGSYSVVISDSCGSVQSQAALLTLACPADVDDGSGTNTPDGAVGIEDLTRYLALFAQGSVLADVDDGNGQGRGDLSVGIEDLLYFLVRFEIGC